MGQYLGDRKGLGAEQGLGIGQILEDSSVLGNREEVENIVFGRGQGLPETYH